VEPLEVNWPLTITLAAGAVGVDRQLRAVEREHAHRHVARVARLANLDHVGVDGIEGCLVEFEAHAGGRAEEDVCAAVTGGRASPAWR